MGLHGINSCALLPSCIRSTVEKLGGVSSHEGFERQALLGDCPLHLVGSPNLQSNKSFDHGLRWLKTVSSTFHDLDFDVS